MAVGFAALLTLPIADLVGLITGSGLAFLGVAAIGATVFVQVGWKLFSGNAMRLGNNAFLGTEGLEIVRYQDGQISGAVDRFDSDTPWFYNLTDLRRGQHSVGRLETLFFSMGGVQHVLYGDDGGHISQLMQLALQARLSAQEKKIVERLQAGQAYIRPIVSTPRDRSTGELQLKDRAVRIQVDGRLMTIPFSEASVSLARGRLVIQHRSAPAFEIPTNKIGGVRTEIPRLSDAKY